ncbi:DUF2871 family protein, partial [Staphylococcus aureus]
FFYVYNSGVIVTIPMFVTKGFFHVTSKSYSRDAISCFTGVCDTRMLAGLSLLSFLLIHVILK